MATSYSRARPATESSSRHRALLGRYPELTEHELAELVERFSNLTLLEKGLITADDDLAEKLAHFHRDHGQKSKAPPAGVVAVLSLPALVTIFSVWWVLT